MTGEGGSHPDLVTVELEAGVAIITLNRPDKLNALDSALLERLSTVISASDDNPSVRAIVLRGRGRAFCAGADRKAIAALRTEGEIRQYAGRMADAMLALGQARTPTIAAVHGYALGAGCGLVTACDMAVAAADSVLGFPEIGNGIMPTIVTPVLIRAVGPRRAFSLLASSRRMAAAEAAVMGLVDQVTASDVLGEARKWAVALASAPSGLPERVKDLVWQCAGEPLRSAVEIAENANVKYRLERSIERD